jgi:iron only hydrogenase large subunit-like protein
MFHSVYLDAELCIGCTTCIKHCPTQAIRVRLGKAQIMEERCIDCGECIRVCPKGAKKSVSDPLALMDGFDIKVALPAPSLYGQFGGDFSPQRVFEALRAVSFDEVFDVAWGARILTDAVSQALPNLAKGSGPVISSACPVVVRLIQLRFPSLIPNLLPFLPPVEVAARNVRTYFRTHGRAAAPSDLSFEVRDEPRIGIFFISPCTSKVTAIRSPLGYSKSEVDAVFSFQDIFTSLKAALAGGAKVLGTGRKQLFPRMAGLGRGFGWARSDGELEALSLPGAVSVDGISNVIALFEELDNGKLTDIPYIEALACPGGCVGGPMAVANPHVARTTIKAISRLESADSETRAQGFSLAWEFSVPPKPVMVLHRDMAEALAMAESMETIAKELPGLDCGACGAPDCRALAEDIVKGLARKEDCLIRMREQGCLQKDA